MIPPDATHAVLPSDLSYDRTPTFMKWGFWFVGPESGLMRNSWYIWHRGEWKQDLGFMASMYNRHEHDHQLLTIEKYTALDKI